MLQKINIYTKILIFTLFILYFSNCDALLNRVIVIPISESITEKK